MALTEGFAKDRGFLEKVEDKLELADLPLRPAEVMLFYFVAIVVITLLALVLTQNIIVGLVVLAICLLAGPALLDMRARQRQRKFTAQLPDMLNLLSGALRAGFSLMQAVDAVSQEIEDPMGKEMRRVVTEARLGRALEEALEDTAVRTGSADFAWAVMAIRIQREVGGNLAELLMTVAETMVQRERLRREVKSLTAEGRISAIVLGLLPPGLAVVMYVINPGYMSPLFHEFAGSGRAGRGDRDDDCWIPLDATSHPDRRLRQLHVHDDHRSHPVRAGARHRTLLRDRQLDERQTVRTSIRQLEDYGHGSVVETERDRELLKPACERAIAPVMNGLVTTGRRVFPTGYVAERGRSSCRSAATTRCRSTDSWPCALRAW